MDETVDHRRMLPQLFGKGADFLVLLGIADHDGASGQQLGNALANGFVAHHMDHRGAGRLGQAGGRIGDAALVGNADDDDGFVFEVQQAVHQRISMPEDETGERKYSPQGKCEG